MWYVLYCPKGNEEAILNSCRQRISTCALTDAFLFTYERMKRYQGSWHLEKEKMFPCYLFLESENGALLSEELNQYPGILQELGDGESLTPVNAEEEHLLTELCGTSRHMSMSRGIIRHGITHVTEGPLKGKEQLIAKIDRHKRLAILLPPGFHKGAGIKAGLEITEKTM